MLNIKLSRRTDGPEGTRCLEVVEISEKDCSISILPTLERRTVRSLRSEELAGEFPRFVDNSDGTVTDTTTGLMWTKEDVGSGELKHSDAETVCKHLVLAGHTDWRLPTRAELLTLVDDTRCSPAIDTNAFPSCKNGWYWSSTITAWNPAFAWIVGFGSGGASCYNRYNEAFVRAVRVAPAGQ